MQSKNKKINLARDVETKDTKYEEVLFMNPITLKPKTSIYGLLWFQESPKKLTNSGRHNPGCLCNPLPPSTPPNLTLTCSKRLKVRLVSISH